MSILRAVVSVALAGAGIAATFAACSADSPVPKAIDPGGSKDAGFAYFDSGPHNPCDPPVDGCPCTDAGIGSQLYCGVIYRTSGGHVDCSKGYRTCLEDGGWGPCVGDMVFTGD